MSHGAEALAFAVGGDDIDDSLGSPHYTCGGFVCVSQQPKSSKRKAAQFTSQLRETETGQ